MKQQQIGFCKLLLGDCHELMRDLPQQDLIFLDPPFDEWVDMTLPEWQSLICFTNFQNREKITDQFGKPRSEIIWHFKDGRWVSNTLPLVCHETILIYGNTNQADVGITNKDAGIEIKKGKSYIGKDQNLGTRRYIPKQRKQLKSVYEHPRMNKDHLGSWTKPLPLIHQLTEFCAKTSVLDLFMGSGTMGIVCNKLGLNYIGVEKDERIFEMACKRIYQENLQMDFFKWGEYLNQNTKTLSLVA